MNWIRKLSLRHILHSDKTVDEIFQYIDHQKNQPMGYWDWRDHKLVFKKSRVASLFIVSPYTPGRASSLINTTVRVKPLEKGSELIVHMQPNGLFYLGAFFLCFFGFAILGIAIHFISTDPSKLLFISLCSFLAVCFHLMLLIINYTTYTTERNSTFEQLAKIFGAPFVESEE